MQNFNEKIDSDTAEIIFNKSKIGLSFVSREGQFIRCNETMCNILGYTEPELKKKKFSDITHPEDFSEDMEMLIQVLTGEIDEYPITKRYITKSGSSIWVKLIVTAIKDDNNNVMILFSQISPIVSGLNQDISLIFDSKLKELQKISKGDVRDQQDVDPPTHGPIINHILKEWKWISIFILTGIGGAIAWETSRRVNQYTVEQRFHQIETQFQELEKINDQGFRNLQEAIRNLSK